jgi:hypothetical protein
MCVPSPVIQAFLTSCRDRARTPLVSRPPAALLIKALSRVCGWHLPRIDHVFFLLAQVAAVRLPPVPLPLTRSLNPVLQSREHAAVTSYSDPKVVLEVTGGR